MILFRQLSGFSKRLIILTIVFIIYGYFCRLFQIRFFWESKFIGWFLFYVSLVFYFYQDLKYKRSIGKRVLFNKIIIFICGLVVVLELLFFVFVPHFEVYKAAKRFILANDQIAHRYKAVKKIILVPYGKVAVSRGSTGESGMAELNVIVIGDVANGDLFLEMSKQEGEDWKVDAFDFR